MKKTTALLIVITLVSACFALIGAQQKEIMNKPITIDTIIIFTENLDSLSQFYAKGLGIGPYEKAPNHLGCQLGSVYFGFDRVAKKENAGNSVTVWFSVEDIDTVYARLLSLGAKERSAPSVKPWGDILASVYDSDGNIIGLVKKPQ
jgi:lactoylglutathione lyase